MRVRQSFICDEKRLKDCVLRCKYSQKNGSKVHYVTLVQDSPMCFLLAVLIGYRSFL